MTPAPVQPFYDAAKKYVQRAFAAQNVALDDSEESLAYVDHYINVTARAEALKPEVLALVAPALGAYFGEVAIKRFGGKWITEGDSPADWRIELEPAPLTFHPVGMAAEALRGDEVEGYDATFSTPPELMGPLLEALDAAPPVDQAYYYSLTGRFETLTHALDILVEIERRKRDDKAN
ncbi:MAG: hypothetical protein JWM53_6102 [bacterium]|nr:hypothetical protein [bacterium]